MDAQQAASISSSIETFWCTHCSLLCRLPQLLSRCCNLCNATDWSGVPWASRTPGARALGSGTRVLGTSASASSTLGDVFESSLLLSACKATASCSSNHLRWQLGDWTPCSSTCGGGRKTRPATCVDSVSGAVRDAQDCRRALGHVPVDLLTAECGTKPCALYIWQVLLHKDPVAWH
jgi:hypothetical protein